MVVRNTYRAGDYLVVCDRCHMTRYRSECRFTWDNLLVCGPCWLPRHPQDFVHGVIDDQSVPVARPDIPQTMGETTVKTAAAKNATSIALTSITGIASGDSIGITLDGNGEVCWTFSNGTPAGDTVTLGSYLPAAAGAGNTVYVPSINNLTFITALTPVEL